MKITYKTRQGWKLYVSAFLMLCMLICPLSKAEEIKLYVDGKTVAFDTTIQIVDGRTMVPFRAMFEALGAKVIWEEETKTALCKSGVLELRITQGEKLAMLNNRPIYMDAEPIIVNDRPFGCGTICSRMYGLYGYLAGGSR